MKAAVLLPHTRLYGGVKRFFELGAALGRRGHELTVYTLDGAPPDWGDYGVGVRPIAELGAPDVLFFTERRFFETARDSRARYRVFYHVREGDRVRRIVRHRDIQVFACSSNIYRYDRLWYGVRPFLAIGGVDCSRYTPKPIREKPAGEPFVVMAYGRIRERRKGTSLVVAACERLAARYPDLRLLLFDTPVTDGMRRAAEEFRAKVPFELVLNHPVERNVELFHRADVFVAAEKRAGWANTVAEAMAAGVPVIATRSGTLDLVADGETGVHVRRSERALARAIERMMNAPIEERTRLAGNARRHVQRFDWNVLARRIVEWYEEMERRRAA